jgi:Flp pilus assembly protein TadD
MKIQLPLTAIAALVLTVLAPAQTPDAAALHQLSIDRLQQKDAKGAVDYAEQATKADATKPEYFSQLGVALSQRMNDVNFMQKAMLAGKLKKAFEKSVELDPSHVAGLIGLTRYYANAPEIAGGSLGKAGEFAGRVQQLNPFLGEIELGRVAEKGENYASALAHYEAAAALKPDHAGLQYACGQQLARLDRKDEARTRFTSALQLNPDHAAARNALAELDAAVAGKP